ncbi:MAG TPA: hypothetical protein VJ831_15580 [Jatrophihabitantaceae bacterium]|nr:hypothetical protein [Jatrophihabitantaceae bacterium]
MTSQHLSDEALAAFADGVLRNAARSRAIRHVNGCPECAHAVAVQREAVWALRAAPAPALPTGLFDRLTALPDTTPLDVAPATIAPDGSAMFATFGSMSVAALAPASSAQSRAGSATLLRKAGPIALTAAALAAASVVAIGSAAHANRSGPTSRTPNTGVVPANSVPGAALVDPADVSRLLPR